MRNTKAMERVSGPTLSSIRAWRIELVAMGCAFGLLLGCGSSQGSGSSSDPALAPSSAGSEGTPGSGGGPGTIPGEGSAGNGPQGGGAAGPGSGPAVPPGPPSANGGAANPGNPEPSSSSAPVPSPSGEPSVAPTPAPAPTSEVEPDAEPTPSVGGEYPEPGELPEEDGSELWLRYPKAVEWAQAEYQPGFVRVVDSEGSETIDVAEAELVRGLSGLTGNTVTLDAAAPSAGSVVLGTPASSTVIAGLPLAERLGDLGSEGYLVEAAQTADGANVIAIAANSDVGVLYGAFALLRHVQMHRPLAQLSLRGVPKVQHRLLNHWDNLDGSVERGYAGRSLWAWNSLPGTLSDRYVDYARANASIGINGVVLTNVNADAQVLTASYIDKVGALADVFRPYGIAVYLTARFSAPSEIGGLSTADPADAAVQQWWATKADEIYARIPDFGGFLVKANSEGQPGPQTYGRTHADGANLLADALGTRGIVMWRAFVYSDGSTQGSGDRIREAYDEFHPLDGQFQDNVVVQVKNGPLDFQPREPFSPLFGAMPETPLALELQITKEYLGQDTHLAYLGPLYEEVLEADTFADGEGSPVARVVDGSLHGYSTTVMAGVSNVGSDVNWTGSHFNQANWYVFGRMAWDPDASAEAIADEWVRQTFSNDPVLLGPVTEMMMQSRQALVDYMTPLGLAHIMASDHHYGPGPWVDDLSRPEWNPVYYHRADAQGIGFDRTAAGSNAVEQYFSPLRETLGDRESIPEDLLLFFHHVGWQETLSSGRTLWEELAFRYSRGVDAVGAMREAWSSVQSRVDAKRFAEVEEFLRIQHYEARWWRDACLEYFRQFANLELPEGYAPAANPLSFYENLNCPSNVTRPRCDQVYTGEPSPAVLP